MALNIWKVNGEFSIGPGWTIGPAANAAPGPAPGPVTYTQGVEYSVGGLQISGGMIIFDMTATEASWSDTAAFNVLKSQPSGTTFTVTRSGMQYTGTTNATWTYGSGTATTTIDFTGNTAPPGGPPANITVITFTPA